MTQSFDTADFDTDEDATVLFTIDPHNMTAAQFTALGVSRVAYVKPVMNNGSRAFAIHAADGTAMALAGDEQVALAAIVQHEMLPARVH